MNIIDRLTIWFDQPITVRNECSDPFETTIGAWIAELTAVNGKRTSVSSWGVITTGGMYGRMGLTQDEALELMRSMAFLAGVVFVAPEVKMFIDQKLEMYWLAQERLLARENSLG